MKPKTVSKKLVLNKKTIATIMNGEMQKVLAGDMVPATWGQLSCETGCNTLYYNQQCDPHLIWCCEELTETVV